VTSEVTIYDVAARAGVSISTVSLSLNRPDRVSPTTRDRVLHIVEELGFIPKETAVARARRGVGRIGVLAPFTSYGSYGRRLHGVMEALRESNLDIVVYDHESAAQSTSPLLSSLPLSRHLDGLIVMGLPLEPETADRLHGSDLPAVLVDTDPAGFDAVNIDDEQAGALVGRYLLGKGHGSIAFVHEPQRSLAFVSQGQRRLAGLRRVFVAAGRSDSDVVEVIVSNDVEGGRQAARDVRASSCTAAFAHHDLLAAGLLSQLRADAVDVPGELAILGFDDGDVAESLRLSTVRQPFEESGRVAAGLLLEALSGRRRSRQQITLAVEVVTRETG
jgi:DNA-binding LacI/PurR family transcriptional regulator